MVMNISIEPMRYNSKCITFTDWISLITLCLAPLIAHVASGAPQPSYLTDRRPKWYDYMCIYNPTSIIWRYAAITDRRIRAKNWSHEDFAASNAIFWTSNGWDGGEHMGSMTAAYCLRRPEGTHTALFSLTMFKTVITTLQGVSAVYLLMSAIATSSLPTITSIGFGIDTLFFPLAILGLLRLCAAAWLTEDYVYQNSVRHRSSTWELGSPRSPKSDNKGGEINVHESRSGLDPLLASQFQSAGFRSPAESWGSGVFRFCFLCLVWTVWLLAFFCAVPVQGGHVLYTMTFFMLGIFYLLFTSITAITYTILFFKGKTTNTIIPCVSNTWYRLYTLLFTGFMVGIILVAAIETNKGPDGLYTSWNPKVDLGCVGREDFWWLIPRTRFLGLASNVEFDKKWLTRNQTSVTAVAEHGMNSSAPETFWLYNFTGYCVGRINNV